MSEIPFSKHHSILLGVNVDHIATLRQARGVSYPDPAQAADIARKAGADGVTIHLREDRRHIQDADVLKIRSDVALPMNFEIAATDEMRKLALKIKPAEVCLVPEKRTEVTTEGGLNVVGLEAHLKDYIQPLKQAGIKVAFFIDPDSSHIEASARIGADIIEIHTGDYANSDGAKAEAELKRISAAATKAAKLGLQVNAGHGLHYQNVQAIAAIPEIECLNIGHAIVSRAALTGMHEAVFAMKQIMIASRLKSEQGEETQEATS